MSSGNQNAFSPLGASVTVVAPNGSSSASTALPGSGGFSCKVNNQCTGPVHVAFSTVSGGAAALANSLEVAAGITEVFGIPFGTADVAVWGEGVTGNVSFTRGDGQ